MNANRIISIISMFIVSIFYYNSFSYPDESTIYIKFILVILLVLSVLLFVNSKSQNTNFKEKSFSKRMFLAFALTIAYVALMPIVGYYISTFIFLVLFMWIYNHKGIVKYLTVGCIFSFFVYFFFQKLLGIWFPTGIFM